jgi:hypothetical protein
MIQDNFSLTRAYSVKEGAPSIQIRAVALDQREMACLVEPERRSAQGSALAVRGLVVGERWVRDSRSGSLDGRGSLDSLGYIGRLGRAVLRAYRVQELCCPRDC